jgi:CCR4-NOT transcription complex subunit 4
MHAIRSTVSEVEEDILAVERPCLKDPEEASHDTYLPNSAHLPHIPNHYRSSSLQHTESFGAASLNSDSQYSDTRVSDLSLLHSSSNCVTSNGYPEKLVSSSACSDRSIERSFSLLNGVEGKNMGRSLGDADSNGALDVGESSIISNILSLDLDAWDNSLTSPQNLAKLLSETDNQPSSLKMSSNWKVQNNNNQSRFSFARQEELRSQTLGVDPSLNVFGKLSNNYSSNQDFGENRNSYMEKLGIGNSVSSSIFEEPENFTFSPSTFSSNRPPSKFFSLTIQVLCSLFLVLQ